MTDITEESRNRRMRTRRRIENEWNAIWEPLGVDPGTPREMKQWLLRVDKLIANVQSANTGSGDARNLAEDCKALKECRLSADIKIR